MISFFQYIRGFGIKGKLFGFHTKYVGGDIPVEIADIELQRKFISLSYFFIPGKFQGIPQRLVFDIKLMLVVGQIS
jgi:hypothetical protein